LPYRSQRDLEIFRRGLASIGDEFVLDDLTLIETGQAGPFDGQDVYEDVPATVLRLDEPISLFSSVRLKLE
jgi:hypothetical protein